LLKELANAVASAHEGTADPGKQPAKIDYSEVLKRLINIQLMVREAREIGFDELPEIKNQVKANSKTVVRQLLIEDVTKDVKVDKVEVESFHRKMVTEWKIKSVLFEKEDDAKKMEEELKTGKDFDELARKAMADKSAKEYGQSAYVKSKDILPEVAEVVSKMKIGEVSPVIKSGPGKEAGFTLMKLEENRIPNDPETVEKARAAVLDTARYFALGKFKGEAYKKHVKVNNKLLKSLDFEAKIPGFDKMMKDERTVATIEGSKPVTVRDIADALAKKFYHGVERAIEGKKLNDAKEEVLDGLIEKKVFEIEASKRGIEKTEKFRRAMKEYENSLLFGVFVQKVIISDVKTSEEELKAYYSGHISDYTIPEMIKISGLAFGDRGQAEAVLERLKKGADFDWMKSNAEGQMDKDKPNLLSFEGGTVFVKNLPQGIQKALTAAHAEDYRLYESPEGGFYVLYVREVVPPGQQSFEVERGDIAKIVFNEKMGAAVEKWADKLRESAEVKIYLSNPAASGEKSEKK